MRDRAHSPLIVLASLFASLLVGGVAFAAPAVATTPAESPTPEPGRQQPTPRIELILDSSGSMAQHDAGGQTRMAAAKQAMYDLIDGIPDEADVGLRVYGATYPGDNKKKGCRDSQLIVPIGQMSNKSKTKAKISELGPTGFTPIGRALRQAGKDLGSSGPRRIVLVSDGKDTCAPPDPCKVAKDLGGKGINLTIDTVGFNVGDKARKQLKCIAEATGGQYSGASESDELLGRIKESFRRAVKGYQASGIPIEGSRDGCKNAPVLKKDGKYLDHISYGHTAWYRVNVAQGQSLRLTAATILISSFGRGASTELTLTRPDGEEITNDFENTMGWVTFLGNGIQTDTFGRQDVPAKSGTAHLCLSLNNGVGFSNGTLFPTEIRVHHYGEPAAAATSHSPSPSSSPSADEERTAEADESAPIGTLPLTAGLGGAGIVAGCVSGLVYARRRRQ